MRRSNYGDYFGITVAGYPEAHPEVITDDPEEMERAYQNDLQYLKKKVFSQQLVPLYYTHCKACYALFSLSYNVHLMLWSMQLQLMLFLRMPFQNELVLPMHAHSGAFQGCSVQRCLDGNE